MKGSPSGEHLVRINKNDITHQIFDTVIIPNIVGNVITKPQYIVTIIENYSIYCGYAYLPFMILSIIDCDRLYFSDISVRVIVPE